MQAPEARNGSETSAGERIVILTHLFGKCNLLIAEDLISRLSPRFLGLGSQQAVTLHGFLRHLSC